MTNIIIIKRKNLFGLGGARNQRKKARRSAHIPKPYRSKSWNNPSSEPSMPSAKTMKK